MSQLSDSAGQLQMEPEYTPYHLWHLREEDFPIFHTEVSHTRKERE
uniref:Uncharacterized protein n=1 Tax=Planktothrix agardhii TaxID=1160 RepID=A0A1J1JCV3_PLAAG|nr:protein of unknown function [Planktothrix agardhii]